MFGNLMEYVILQSTDHYKESKLSHVKYDPASKKTKGGYLVGSQELLCSGGKEYLTLL